MPPTARTGAAATRRHGPGWSRAFAWPVAALLAVGVAACGDDADGAEDVDAATDEVSDATGLDANGMLGLEVTSAGEVTEILENNAFRMDKDGLDPGTDASAQPTSEEPDDLDYYDTDGLTAGDQELGYGTEQEDVLVLVPGADLDLRSGDPVVVSGTVRSLDAEGIEEVYDVAIDEDVYAPYENQLVIIAQTVRRPAA